MVFNDMIEHPLRFILVTNNCKPYENNYLAFFVYGRDADPMTKLIMKKIDFGVTTPSWGYHIDCSSTT